MFDLINSSDIDKNATAILHQFRINIKIEDC